MKLIISLACLIFITSLFGVDLTVEKVGDTALLALKIDSNELFAKDKIIDYRAIFEIFNNEGEVVSLTKNNIYLEIGEFTNKNIILFIETELATSSYIAYLKLNNNLRNDKKEEKFNFIVDESKYSSNLYLIESINDTKIEILSWDEVNDNSDIYLFQIYQQEADLIKFVSENQDERKVTEFSPTKRLYQKIGLTDLIQDFSKIYIEYTINNKVFQNDLIIEKHLNSFQRKYSWEEQLEQIKYIVNDKTWKEINRDSNMSVSEKVLRFWDNNNPVNSQKNELQEIFYNRVLHVDQKFSVHRYKKGWETDRGRIYIKFGEPDEIGVDNHPIGKYPTQTWFYYQLNKTFLFYDRSRIEDYKLYNKEEEYGY